MALQGRGDRARTLGASIIEMKDTCRAKEYYVSIYTDIDVPCFSRAKRGKEFKMQIMKEIKTFHPKVL